MAKRRVLLLAAVAIAACGSPDRPAPSTLRGTDVGFTTGDGVRMSATLRLPPGAARRPAAGVARQLIRRQRHQHPGRLSRYGRCRYRLERTRVVDPTALWVTRRVAHERPLLTACHPLYSAAQRIVVFARLTRAEPAAPGT
jgi:hypothetical protein